MRNHDVLYTLTSAALLKEAVSPSVVYGAIRSARSLTHALRNYGRSLEAPTSGLRARFQGGASRALADAKQWKQMTPEHPALVPQGPGLGATTVVYPTPSGQRLPHVGEYSPRYVGKGYPETWPRKEDIPKTTLYPPQKLTSPAGDPIDTVPAAKLHNWDLNALREANIEKRRAMQALGQGKVPELPTQGWPTRVLRSVEPSGGQ